jgi:predicted ATP-grasp superfamily ATP-dependent carboligase
MKASIEKRYDDPYLRIELNNDMRSYGSPQENDDFPGAIVLGGHAQGLGIIRSLGRRQIKVYLVDDTAACIGRFSKYCRRFFHVPKMKQERALLAFLKTLSKREGINGWVVFPTHDATVEILSRNRDVLGDLLRISIPDWSATKIAYNKELTYHLAKRTGVPVAHTYFPRNGEDLRRVGGAINYPTIIKPAIMHTFYARFKTKVFKANNLQELILLYEKTCTAIDPSEVMIQDIIPGAAQDLYSCGCFFKQGVMMASCIGQHCRQIPMDFGKATTFVQSVDIPELRAYSEKLLSEIGYYGLAEVEFMRDPRDGAFKLLEINPRSWKWHTLAIKAGVDLPYLIFNDLVGGATVEPAKGQLNVKWVELISDLYIALTEMIKGKLRPRDYITSLQGNLEFAIASRDDPKPFISYLLMLPYLLFSR